MPKVLCYKSVKFRAGARGAEPVVSKLSKSVTLRLFATFLPITIPSASLCSQSTTCESPAALLPGGTRIAFSLRSPRNDVELDRRGLRRWSKSYFRWSVWPRV